MTDQREAIAQALRDSYGEPPERGMETVAQWEARREREIEAEIARFWPFVEQAEQRGYERGQRDENARLQPIQQMKYANGRREALAEARAKIEDAPQCLWSQVELVALLDELKQES